MSEEKIKKEMFELSNHEKVLGVRLKFKDKLGFDCFLYKPDKKSDEYLDDRFILYDEMSGMSLGYVQQDLEVSLEKLKTFIRRKTEYENIVNMHNKNIEDGNILTKFSKDIKITLQYDKKLIQFTKIEYFNEFLEFSGLNNYFENIYCHKLGNGSNDYVQNNTCYIFCGGLHAPRGLKHEEKYINIQEELIPVIDVLDYLPVKNKGNISRDIIFYTRCFGKKYILANYIYDMNTLILSDISHDKNFEWIKPFIDNLKDNILTKNKDIQNKEIS
jgi:hypothetical protein